MQVSHSYCCSCKGISQESSRIGKCPYCLSDKVITGLTELSLSSGKQGYCELHKSSPWHKIILAFGYHYSHTTPVHRGDEISLHHTYSQFGHFVSVYSWQIGVTYWETSTGTGSGRKVTGHSGTTLEKHLWNKSRRYTALKSSGDCLSLAHRELSELSDLRKVRSEMTRLAYAAYGDHGSLIAGIERAHFPQEVIRDLRQNAQAITACIDTARILFKRAHKRDVTFLKALRNVPQFNSRY